MVRASGVSVGGQWWERQDLDVESGDYESRDVREAEVRKRLDKCELAPSAQNPPTEGQAKRQADDAPPLPPASFVVHLAYILGALPEVERAVVVAHIEAVARLSPTRRDAVLTLTSLIE